jgi:hypothetical protein
MDELPEESYCSSAGMVARGNVNVEDSSSDFLQLVTADCPLPDPNPTVMGGSDPRVIACSSVMRFVQDEIFNLLKNLCRLFSIRVSLCILRFMTASPPSSLGIHNIS